MKYNKPELVAMAGAVRGIQSTQVKAMLPAECVNGIPDTTSAYEADE